MKIKILKTGLYAETIATNIIYNEGDIVDIKEDIAKDFVKGKLAIFVQDNIDNTIIIETPKQPELETKPVDLGDLEYKALKEQAENDGFVNEGKGKPSKSALIEFLRGKEND